MKTFAFVLACGVAAAAVTTALAEQPGDWAYYGKDAGGTRFSPLNQITPANVSKLKVAWRYDLRPADVPKLDNALVEQSNAARLLAQSGVRPMPMPGNAAPPAGAAPPPAAIRSPGPTAASQFTPIVVDGTMFLGTPFGRLVALDPVTGKEKWSLQLPTNDQTTPRGIHYWPGDKANPARLVVQTRSNKLTTVDPKTGKINAQFGENGYLDLRTPDMMNGFPNGLLTGNGMPVMYRNVVIVGSRGQENPQQGPRGDIRGFDVVTGKLLWTFHSIPEPGEPNFGTWQGDTWQKRAGVNIWNMATVDDQRGIVYLPFGTPASDRDGRDRIGDGLYGTSLVAVDAMTGKYLWHFQTVHHDIWDADMPAAPTLVDVKRDGKTIPAVAVINKQTLLFILDRVTGKPLYDVQEVPVPKSDLPGEVTSPTQPMPVKTPPLGRRSVKFPDDISDASPEHEAYCKKWVADNHMVGTEPYQPLGFNVATVTFPGSGGGVDWGGGAFDKANGNYVVNITNQGSLQFLAMDPGGKLVQPVSSNSWFANVRNNLMPCQKGPWGELVAVNVNTGDIAWRTTLGVTDALPEGKRDTGRPNVGGPIVTAGGLIFIAATDDKRFRAFNAKTGKLVWETKMEAAGHATPLTYKGRNGKQYVSIIATGGAYLASPSTNDFLETFALP